MNSSAIDYKKLYKLQNKVFPLILPVLGEFYLTGGTALGRFYLDHRYSNDLDFFVNQNPYFEKKTQDIFNVIKSNYQIDEKVTFQSTDFVRIIIIEDLALKIEFVNDVTYRWGKTFCINEIPIDNVANMLANKFTALLSRDEPKDVYDIVSISCLYNFNWKEIYSHAFKKQLMNETDIAMRLNTFPLTLLENQPWLKQSVDIADMKAKIETITDDFIFARDNSLGVGKVNITDAVPRIGIG